MHKKITSIRNNFSDFIDFLIRERRLPSRLTHNLFWQSYSFYNQQIKNKVKSINSEDFVLINLPHLRHRYIYQILHLFHLAYPQVAFFWDFSLDNYIKLGNEGRRLFSILNLKIISNLSTQLKPSTFVSPEDSQNLKFQAINPKLKVIINTDLSQKAKEESLLIPYSVHPHFLQNYKGFNQEILQLRSNYREISIFFAGNIQNLGDKHLVERFYNVPSRDRCIQFLLKSSEELNIYVISDARFRRNMFSLKNEWSQYSAVICICKGLPQKWLFELSSANFFLALPGGYMLMCHNVIEAMAVGTIPILCYEDWFSPNLVHGENCLTYKTLDEIPDLIKLANSMNQNEIERMRGAVINYYEHYLNPSKIADFIKSYKGSNLNLYINHEDADTLREVTDDSILRTGGTLQSLL